MAGVSPDDAVVFDNKPMPVELEAGKGYAYCTVHEPFAVT